AVEHEAVAVSVARARRVARTEDVGARDVHCAEPSLRGLNANDRPIVRDAIGGHRERGRSAGPELANEVAVAVDADRDRARRGRVDPRGEPQPPADALNTDER